MRTANAIELTNAQRQDLQRMARSHTVSVRLARRAQIVLLACDGFDNKTIAEQLGIVMNAPPGH